MPMSEEMDSRLRHGEKIGRIFVQEQNHPSSAAEQLILYYALKTGVLDNLPDAKCDDFKKNILKFAEKKIADVVKNLEEEKELSNYDRERLNECIRDFFRGVT